MKKGFLLAIVSILLSTCCVATPIQWTLETGGNAHYYEIVEASWQSWDDSNEAAQQRQYQGLKGYMATVTSQAENDFISTLIQNVGVANHYYLGGYQPPGSPEPDGNWQWVTGEPWVYSNWNDGEPDMQYSEENALIIYSHLSSDVPWKWNDVRSWDTYASWGSYIVEYTPEPACEVEMVLIPGGEFEMGDNFNEGMFYERPVHTVYISSFDVGKCEITNQQYRCFLNDAIQHGLITVYDGAVYSANDIGKVYPYCYTHSSPPSYGQYSQIDYSNGVFSVKTKNGRTMSNDPMVCVSWCGAAAYCNWLSQQQGKDLCYNLSTWECDFTKNGYRLPTEAEWEYAARGGLSGKRFPWGDTITHSQANYYSSDGYSYDISPTRGYHPLWNDGIYPYTSPVGFFDGTLKYKTAYNWPGSTTSYQTTSGANNYGLYDMAGNVWEWCNDWFSETYYSVSPAYNPHGPNEPDSSNYRVRRGGSWGDDRAYLIRVAERDMTPMAEVRVWGVGFRVASKAESTGLIAYWPFDGNANDASGNGHNGIVHGATLTEDRCGNPNSAYLFDGSNGYIEVPHANELNPEDLTIALWVNFNQYDSGVSNVMVDKTVWAPDTGYYLSYSSNEGLFFAVNDDVYRHASNVHPDLNTWTHFAATYERALGTTEIFVNGQSLGKQTGAPFMGAPTVPLYFGKIRHDDYGTRGKLDEIRIYNRALSESEIIVLMGNCTPSADAGDNIQIASNQQPYTVIQGTATDPDGDVLQYRWLEDSNALADWNDVGPAGEAYLNLGTLPYLAIGNHTLTLEVGDGQLTDSDDMILTVDNSPPEVQAAPNYQIVEIGIDPIIVIADAADYDGDSLLYEWLKDANVLESGTVVTTQGGDTVAIPDLLIPAGDPQFPVGLHSIELQASDGVNEDVNDIVTVEVTDTTAPSLSPVPSMTILWPPNHKLVPVTIQANAFDNGGGTIVLDVNVTSSELPDTDGDGNTIPDYYIDSVDNETGIIELRLRSERSGKGDGRTYTITITATDESANQSVAVVEIIAPHDKRKK
jgi:formylglycine-generating enzyme required for sulfatase activity